MADEPVRPARHELRVVLLRHRRSPIVADVDPRPDCEQQPGCVEREPDARTPRVRLDAVAAEHAEPHKDDGKDDDERPDAQLARPRDPASLDRERRRDPVEPEQAPADCEDELDSSHRGR